MSYNLNALLWLVLIVALIPVTLWLLKRTPMGQGGAPGAPRHVAVLPLSNSQRLVTVEVGLGEQRCWLVLGVTPQSITTLHTMLPGAEPLDTMMPPAPAFAALLSRLKQPPKDDHGL